MQWSDTLVLGNERMDETHREFVEQLNALADASDADFLVRLDAFIAHTEAHFGQEDQWMSEIYFPPAHCHQNEHEGVLKIAREVRERVAAGDVPIGRVLARELAPWFENHATTMDAVLAYVLKVGPSAFVQPPSGEAAPASHEGCGCGPAAAEEQNASSIAAS